MDTILLSRYMVEAAHDRDQVADSFNLKVIKDNVPYRLAQNLYRYTTPLDEEGNPTGSENMARFPSFLIRLDALLAKYRDGDSPQDDDDEDEREEEDSDDRTGKKKIVKNKDNSDDEDEDDDDNDDDTDNEDDEDDDVDDDSDENDEDEDEDDDDEDED